MEIPTDSGQSNLWSQKLLEKRVVIDKQLREFGFEAQFTVEGFLTLPPGLGPGPLEYFSHNDCLVYFRATARNELAEDFDLHEWLNFTVVAPDPNEDQRLFLVNAKTGRRYRKDANYILETDPEEYGLLQTNQLQFRLFLDSQRYRRAVRRTS